MPPPRRRPAEAFEPVVSAPLTSAPDARNSAAKAFDKVRAKADKDEGKSKVKRLFVYDESLKDGSNVAPLLYPGSEVESFKNWATLTTLLSQYSEVEELILWVHSVDGALLIRDGTSWSRARTAQDTRDLLAKTKLKVTRAVHFEGCNIMRAPKDAAIILSGIAGPGVSATGYTFYMVVQPITVSGLKADDAAALLKNWGEFVIGPPKAESLVGNGKHTFYLRWFGQDINLLAPEKLPNPPTGLRKNEFSKLSELKLMTIANSGDLAKLTEEFEAPVEINGFVVTVSDVLSLAK